MKVTKTDIEGLLIIEPTVFEDERGFFLESYNQKTYQDAGIELTFVQDNHSKSVKGTLRGLHFQKGSKAQDKLIRCIAGEIFDVAVDIRKDSPTFGKWFGLHLSAENKKQLLVPKGFAHGFQTMQENCEMLYLHTDSYSPEDEAGLRYDEPRVGIQWPYEVADISDKDNNIPLLTSEFAGFNL